MLHKVQRYYEWLITEKYKSLIIVVGTLLALLAYQAQHFTLDASAESLLLENDESLSYFREISERYGSQEFLVLTFTPTVPLFDEQALSTLRELRDELRALKHVESVVSILDVPLLSNPPVPLTEMVENIKTLEDPEADIALAEEELANSPLYANLLLNRDANTTALQINFPVDEKRIQLQAMKADLHQQLLLEPNKNTENQLTLVDDLILQHNASASQRLHQDIIDIRKIKARYQSRGELHLGGVPMIADDIISFVRSDLIVFGALAVVLIVGTLTFIFRRVRWVCLPVVCAAAVVISMLGLLGWWRWPATVISSNFISLLLILTLSMNIHLVVRYRELLSKHSQWNQSKLVITTVKRIVVPCLYMSLTTAVAFLSLITSGIRPVISFGWMMTVGMAVAFCMTFILFPALLMLLGKKTEEQTQENTSVVTAALARVAVEKGHVIVMISLALSIFTLLGGSRLIVENSFIDYFDEDTEIYQGMSVIDQRLGGTTPLDVILNFDTTFESNIDNDIEISTPEDLPSNQSFAPNDSASDSDGFSDEFVDEDLLFMDDDDVGSFEDDFAAEDDVEKYWFTIDKVEKIKKLHQYLDQLPQTGKVISLATMIEIAEGFNDQQPFTNIQLALLYSAIPEEFREIVVDPYVSVEENQARINVRILDSLPDLQRNLLLNNIQEDLTNELGFKEGEVQLTGMMVLYNNMLQSLFSSQILTLGAVFVGIMLMFLVLFRSIKLAVIGMAPNLLAATLVLGMMGWLGIPLDIMTITIASITIGIAVDNTIHYIVRYKREWSVDFNYEKAVYRSHGSIGVAIFYTSMTIIMGFSILAFSNFKPTIYFGLLTALSMAVALLGSMTLLPKLILLTHPFGERSAKRVFDVNQGGGGHGEN